MKTKPTALFSTVLCLLFLAVVTANAQSPRVVTLKTLDGMVVKGRVLSQTDDEVTLESTAGNFTLRKDKLTADTAALLNPALPDDSVVLKQRITELEKTIADLRAENQQLRAGLTGITTPNLIRSTSPSTSTSSTAAQSTGYWMSSTGKRHNSNCRYYGTGKGHQCGKDEGVACKICGG